MHLVLRGANVSSKLLTSLVNTHTRQHTRARARTHTHTHTHTRMCVRLCLCLCLSVCVCSFSSAGDVEWHQSILEEMKTKLKLGNLDVDKMCTIQVSKMAHKLIQK